MKPTDYKVGDKLWLVPTDNYGHLSTSHVGRKVTVTKIGRKWVSFGQRPSDRFDPENGAVDAGDYSPPGYIFPSEEAYLEHRALSLAWQDFVVRLTARSRPEGATLEWIAQARVTLGLPEYQA